MRYYDSMLAIGFMVRRAMVRFRKLFLQGIHSGNHIPVLKGHAAYAEVSLKLLL